MHVTFRDTHKACGLGIFGEEIWSACKLKYRPLGDSDVRAEAVKTFSIYWRDGLGCCALCV